MPSSPLNRVIQHLLADLRPDGDGMTDEELLARFVRSRDEDALAPLMRRHARMVWGVCRRLLHHHDAEDAFQATFLVLVRKAVDVPGQAVANWLYGVARQTAVRLRAMAAKRGRREKQVVNMPEPTVPELRDADLQRVVDEELSRLPDHYRGVLVLCDLEGMTRRAAARQLGIPEGSVASRLARARALLAKRLNKRGIVLSGSVAAVLSAGSAAFAPPALVASTIKAASLLAAGQAAGIVSVKVAALTEGVLKAMFLSKLKAVSLLLLVMMSCVTVGGFLHHTQAADPTSGNKSKADVPLATQYADPKSGSKSKESDSDKVMTAGEILSVFSNSRSRSQQAGYSACYTVPMFTRMNKRSANGPDFRSHGLFSVWHDVSACPFSVFSAPRDGPSTAMPFRHPVQKPLIWSPNTALAYGSSSSTGFCLSRPRAMASQTSAREVNTNVRKKPRRSSHNWRLLPAFCKAV